MHLHLLDGTYELFRNYYGAPKRAGPGGTELGAVAGLVAGTLSLVQEGGVTHLGAAFDTVIRSFRNDLFPAYKTEAGVPPDLLAQFPIAEEGLEAIGVVAWRMTTYEADDALATAAARFAPEVEQVVLMSPDKDLAQCVRGHHIVGYNRQKGAFIDEAGVWEKFGVAPESIPDYLALVGDSADGLPGVRGWGAKTTAAVLAVYPHLEDIPLEASLWKPAVRGPERLPGGSGVARGAPGAVPCILRTSGLRRPARAAAALEGVRPLPRGREGRVRRSRARGGQRGAGEVHAGFTLRCGRRHPSGLASQSGPPIPRRP
ncbi:MAG: flap endonuclease [Acidimicrobiia bacterium]|nr:flap endonuclease [Acidimicrobiia bacterium]